MGTITHSIEVNAPLERVYHQWTQFGEFPRFMEGVDEVRQVGLNQLFWKAKIAGIEKQWEAEISEQVPNERIAWQSVGGTPNRGAVSFEPLDVFRTRVTLTMEYEPEGLLEKAGDVLGIPFSEVESDLDRFREFMEKGGSETRPIEAIETSASEPNLVDLHTSSVEQPAEQKSSFQDLEIPSAAVTTEAIASDIGKNGPSPIADEVDEPRLTQKHGTVIADTPRPEAIEGSSIAENVEIDPGSANVLAPTYEQIARRAYELYLERGETPGDERADWLRAEKELSRRAHDR